MKDLRSYTAFFTGHRKIPRDEIELLSMRLEKTLISLIESGYLYFGAGGALGYDTLAAQVVLRLKVRYPQIKLILVLPCLTQMKNWSDYDKRVYEAIRCQADKVVYISLEYSNDCMVKRNRHLVDNSSACICYFTGKAGGTAYTVNYARSRNINIINLANNIKNK